MAKTISRPMPKAQMGLHKKVLEHKALELRDSMRRHAAANIVPRQEEPADDYDLSTRSHEEWIFLNRNSLDLALLRQIQDALARIEQQTYGTCQDCGNPIPRKRLQAVPWATCCIRCQDRHGS